MALTYCVVGQDTSHAKTGQVSFVTSKNIYVKFDDTTVMSLGDSLRLSGASTPCLVIKSKSSTSCVCSLVEGCEIQKGDKVTYTYILKTEVVEEVEPEPLFEPTVLDAEEESLYKEKIRGRISASSYSTIASDRDDRHRLMSRFSLNAAHIRDSKFSFDTYLNYRHILDQAETSSLQKTSFLRVYNLSIRYDALPGLTIIVGRNINPKISSIGAIDGLQTEKQFGKSYVGAIVGFRPDIFDYGFNSGLLQYGGYIGTATDKKNLYAQTTLGFAEQRNGSETDRRYGFFQHSSTFFKKLNLFASMEADLYSKLNDTVSTDIRLTNLYTSVRYRFNRRINLMVSYDSRKRILYYETLQTEIERLLDNDIARQGIRARINVRPFKNVLAGLSYGKRFQSDDQNKSDNLYGYLTLSRLPQLGGRLSLSYNRNQSNYLESNIASLRHSRTLLDNKLNADFYYRFVHYNYVSSIDALQQHYVGADLSYNINRKLLVSISGEWTTYNDENNYRLYSRIVQRF